MIVLIDYLNKPMNFIDFEKLKKKIQGRSVPKPISGTLSGHAAGEPFDKLVFNRYSSISGIWTKAFWAMSKHGRFSSLNIL